MVILTDRSKAGEMRKMDHKTLGVKFHLVWMSVCGAEQREPCKQEDLSSKPRMHE